MTPDTSPAPAPAPGHLLARDGAFYTLEALAPSLDGPLFVATTEDPTLVPGRITGKVAELQPAGRAGGTPIWRL